MEIDKDSLFRTCLGILNEKIKSLRDSLQSVTDAVNNETKSTAGDKHETGRAMMQLEQEKLSAQLNELLNQKDEMLRIDITASSSVVIKGSLVGTDKGYLFITSALGKVKLKDLVIYAISIESPLGRKLLGASVNDKREMNGIVYSIRSIS